jgi:oxygen-independent coproporphyrinogen-3 oxidase
VSLGVQTLAEDVQHAINRVQPREMVLGLIEELRGAGIEAINMDLMYGLPGQSISDLQATLDIAIKLAPNRIALFGYAHMPNLFPRQRRIHDGDRPDSEQRFAMAAFGNRHLTRAGYTAIGFDHFARPDDSLSVAAAQGTLHRNFQGYTDDTCPIMIGFGASAISGFPDFYFQNEKHVGTYRALAKEQNFTVSRGVHRTANDRVRGTLIEKLLCTGNSGPVPGDILEIARPALDRFALSKLARIESGSIIIEPAGLPYSRAIASTLDGYRATGGKQFSLAI